MGRLTQVFIIGLLLWTALRGNKQRHRIAEDLRTGCAIQHTAEALTIYVSNTRDIPPSWDTLSQKSGGVLNSNDVLECQKFVRINFNSRDGSRLIELSTPSNNQILNEQVNERNDQLNELLNDLGKEVREFVKQRTKGQR